MYEAFVYCWTDKATNKLYVGSHKGTTDDGYVCSSKSMMEEYRKRPADFSRQIVAQGTISDMRKLEGVILIAVNARINEQFYNKHNNDGLYFDGWSKETMTAEHRLNIRKAGKGRKLSAEHAQKLHEGRKRSKNSPEHTAAVVASRKESKHTDEVRQKMSKVKLENPTITRKVASLGGKASALKRSENYNEIQSNRMKLWWADRKRKIGG